MKNIPLLFFLLCPLAAHSFQTETFMSVSAGKDYRIEAVSGKLFVELSSAEYKASSEKLEKNGYQVSRRLSEDMDWYTVSFSTGLKVLNSLSALKNLGFKVSPDKIYRLKIVPDDPLLGGQYHLSKISAYTAWEYEVGTSSLVTVAVVDSGIDSTHADLSAKMQASGHRAIDYDGSAVSVDALPTIVTCSHGTGVAGAAAADTDNAAGIAGVSWGAKLLSLNVFYGAGCTADCGDSGGPGCVTSDEALILAINYAKTLHNTAAYGKIVLNMSLGGGYTCDTPIQDAVNSAYAAGILMIAAAGNDYGGDVNSPARCSNVIPVSATDENDNIASFSSVGSAMLNGVSAPGADIYTTQPDGLYQMRDGTSFSSPITSGLAALLWSYKPTYTNVQIAEVLKRSADDLGQAGPDFSFGYGRINAFRAMLMVNDTLQNFSGESKVVAFPNPFYVSRDTYINFSVPQTLVASDMKVRIYGFDGDLVAELKNFSWNGKNSSGAYAASGPYIVFVKSGKGKGKGKFVLIR